MAKRKVFERVYSMCIAGFTASKICRILKRDKGQISRIINALVDAGFLVCVNPRDKIRFYEATKKQLSPDDAVILSTIQQEKKKKLEDGGCFIRCHAMSYLTEVVKMGHVPWDKRWVANGVSHCLYRYPFDGVGEVSFQWMRGGGSNRLRINLPSIWINPSDEDPNGYLRGVADQAGTWFMKRFKCDLRGLVQCGKGHFEVPVRDPSLVSLAQRSSFKRGDFVLDTSLGFPEFGSVGGFDPLKSVLEAPGRIDGVEERLSRIEESVERLSVSVEALTGRIDGLVRLLEAPKRPDEKRDVA